MDTKIIQFSAGNGPAECTWVVAQVVKEFIKETSQENIQYQIITKTLGEYERTIRSVLIQVSGKQVNEYINTWLGSIQWVGSSPYRPNHKRKNWFITCFEIETKNYQDFKEQDVTFQAIRSSGPGGQHANKVSSAVRATHALTGLQVLVSDSRSQHQNKALALQRLKGKFIEFKLLQMQEEKVEQWGQQSQVVRGNPVRVFKGNKIAPKVKKEKYQRSAEKIRWKRDLDVGNR
ncbi:peptide chain release factor H [Wenyingzhuangia sp. IMCC45574]